MSDPFEDIAPLYANVISEATNRLGIIKAALAQPHPEKPVGYVAISDLCALQFRKIFEAIALGCLVVHGSLPGTKRMKDDTYRADKLLKNLERLHADFYPRPCKVTRTPKDLHVVNIPGGWATKELIRRWYFELDHEMHVGTLSRRQLNATAVERASLERMFAQTSALLFTHWITLIDGRRILCETTNGADPIDISLITQKAIH